MFNNITFILHKPQLSENIGACARAMKNFYILKLSIVDPKHMFPNDKNIHKVKMPPTSEYAYVKCN